MDTTLDRFAADITGDTYREAVEQHRRLKAQPGHEAEAKRIKDNMPCVTPSAICFGGHAVTHLRAYSGLLCIDLDHTDGRTDEICRLASALPYVVLVFRSISGSGVKIWAFARKEDLEKGYRPVYDAVALTISGHVGHPYDPQGAVLTQPCYYSWDPEAYYNPQAEAFPMPDTPPTCPPAIARTEPSQAIPTTEPENGEDEDEGFLHHFLHYFEQEYPFRPGQRNSIALKLGRAARRKGFSQKELEKLIEVYSYRHAMPDFNEQDIRQRVLSGYQFVKEKMESEEKNSRVHFRSKVHIEPSTEKSAQEEEADLSEKNEELLRSMPCIPDSVYDRLPLPLEHCTAFAANDRERDILLLGSLTCCSALFSGVSFFYKDRYYSPQLYFAAVAPAGSGKGALSCVASLLETTVEHYEHVNRDRKRAYEEAKVLWEMEQRKALKEKRKPNLQLRPEPPVLLFFLLPATTSRSRLIESLAAAPETGCILFSTEIATLSVAFKQDYGNFEDIFLKAYHHEEVSSSFKIDGEPKRARHPKLAVCLSGTPEQFAGLFRSLDSGLFSRFLFYTRQQEAVWESCAPGAGNVDRETHFRRLGEELFRMHRHLLQSPTIVSFTPAQWEEHTRYFSDQMRRLQANGQEAVNGILVRCGLQTMRMAAVLTAFRKYADWPEAREVTCTDEDFRAALQIASTVLEHSLLLSTSLPASDNRLQEMHRPRLIELVLDSLPEKFSYTEYMDATQEHDVPESTAKRWLKNLQKKQLVEKQEDGYRKQN